MNEKGKILKTLIEHHLFAPNYLKLSKLLGYARGSIYKFLNNAQGEEGINNLWISFNQKGFDDRFLRHMAKAYNDYHHLNATIGSRIIYENAVSCWMKGWKSLSSYLNADTVEYQYIEDDCEYLSILLAYSFTFVETDCISYEKCDLIKNSQRLIQDICNRIDKPTSSITNLHIKKMPIERQTAPALFVHTTLPYMQDIANYLVNSGRGL